MFKWNAFPFIRYTLYFILGILLYEEFPDNFLPNWQPVYVVIALLYVLLTFIKSDRLLIGAFGLMLIVYSGSVRARLNDERNHLNHYSHHEFDSIKAFSGTIVSDPDQTSKYSKYIFRLDSLFDGGSVCVSGKILLYVRKDSTETGFQYGDRLKVSGSILEISEPSNPAVFDYKTYLARDNLFGQSFIEQHEVRKVDHLPPSEVILLAINIRKQTEVIIDELIKDGRPRQIIKALVTGVKSELDPEVQSAYSNAGVIHVLAVSGLHVGIIYLALLWLTKPFDRKWRWFGSIFIIVGIWFYAMVTGLSPSVMRASVMFSVIALQRMTNRSSNVYNSLGIAALILLIYNPNFIYSVGFQLSFLAVLSIVFLHPKLESIFHFRYSIPQKIWSLACVSLAAQIGTTPLVLYYFHQFPSYFLLTNLVVVPVITILLFLTFPLIFLKALGITWATFPAVLVNETVNFLNAFIFLAQKLPYSVVDWIYLPVGQVLILYGILISVLAGWQLRSFMSLCLSLVLMVGLAFNIYISYSQVRDQNLIIVYNTPFNSVFEIVHGTHSWLFQKDSINESTNSFQIAPLRMSLGLERSSSKLELHEAGPLKLFGNGDFRAIYLDDSLNDFDFEKCIESDLLILGDNAIKDLSELDEKVRFKFLVIGSDYYQSLANKLWEQGNEIGIEVHSITKDGFWMLDLSK